MIEFYYLFGSALLGGFIGWWGRSRRDMPERMRLAERFERRVRLAETENEAAVRTLNANQIEVRRIQGLFEGLEARIRELEAEVVAAKNEASVTKKDLRGRQQELAAVSASVAGLRTTNENLASEAREAEITRKDAVSRMAQAEADRYAAESVVGGLEEQVEKTSERVRELTLRSEEADRLESSLAEMRAVLEERDATIAGLSIRVESVVPLEEEIASKREESNRLQNDLSEARATTGERDATIAFLQTRVDSMSSVEEKLEARTSELGDLTARFEASDKRVHELEPLDGEIDEARSALAQRERAWNEQNETLAARANDLEKTLGEVRARIVDLEPLTEETARLKGTLAEKETYWQGTNERSVARAEQAEALLAEAKETTDELAGRVASMKAHEQRAEKELSAIEVKLASREREIEALKDAKAEAKRFSTELARAKRSETGLDGLLAKERERSEKTREKLHDVRDADAKRRSELDDWKERFAKLSASHKAVQLKNDRFAKRVTDLEHDVEVRKQKGIEATREKRERDVLVRGLESKLKKAEATGAKTAAMLDAARQKAGAPRLVARGARAAKKASAKPRRRDDLGELSGVGPAMVKKLSRAGFHAYGDIARLDKDGLATLAEKIGLAPQAIRKNKWVSAASRLHKAKYGTPVES